MKLDKIMRISICLLAAVTPIISINLGQNGNNLTIPSGNSRYKSKRDAANQRLGNIVETQADEFYIRVAIFADASMSEHYGDKLHRHLNVVAKKAARLFRHPTIGNISFHFARPEIVELSKLPESEQFLPKSQDLWTEFNKWRLNGMKQSWSSVMDNHVSILITRKDLRVVGGNEMGLALCPGIADRNESYVVVKDIGHRSAGILAHELGHLLGVEHDTNTSDINSIMSPASPYGLSPRWSEESKNNFTILLRTGRFNLFLLKNDDERPPIIPTDGPEYWATESYTRAEQCQVQYGPDNRFHPTAPKELETCEFLHCGHFESDVFVQAPNWTPYNPIEDGTFCLTETSRGGICVDNQCVESKCQMKI